mgnify:CR=1 FL=1
MEWSSFTNPTSPQVTNEKWNDVYFKVVVAEIRDQIDSD